MKEMAKRFGSRMLQVSLVLSGMLLAPAPVGHAAGQLDTAIESGFGKLVKYGRWGAALVLAVIFCMAWAEKGGNADNPHEVQRGNKRMLWAGAGFVAVIGYKLVLTGLVEWFGVDPATIPAFLWQ